MKLLRRPVSLGEVRAAIPGVPGKGCSLREIAEASESFGVPLEARRLSAEEVLSAPLPLILHLDFTDDGGMGHFVLAYSTTPQGDIYYIDGTTGNSVRTTLDQTRPHLSGFALIPKQAIHSSISNTLSVGGPLMAFGIGLAWGACALKRRKA